MATFKSPGARTLINPAAVIAPNTCAKDRIPARRGGTIPVSAKPRDTAGLNSAPETRKKIHALMTRERPNATAMNIKLEVLTAGANSSVAVDKLAICAAANPINKNIVVPTYSPICNR